MRGGSSLCTLHGCATGSVILANGASIDQVWRLRTQYSITWPISRSLFLSARHNCGCHQEGDVCPGGRSLGGSRESKDACVRGRQCRKVIAKPCKSERVSNQRSRSNSVVDAATSVTSVRSASPEVPCASVSYMLSAIQKTISDALSSVTSTREPQVLKRPPSNISSPPHDPAASPTAAHMPQPQSGTSSTKGTRRKEGRKATEYLRKHLGAEEIEDDLIVVRLSQSTISGAKEMVWETIAY